MFEPVDPVIEDCKNAPVGAVAVNVDLTPGADVAHSIQRRGVLRSVKAKDQSTCQHRMLERKDAAIRQAVEKHPGDRKQDDLR